MHLSPFLILSTMTILVAADSCPGGFGITCCETFRTQPSNAAYLQGVNCKFLSSSSFYTLNVLYHLRPHPRRKLTMAQVIRTTKGPHVEPVRPIDSAAYVILVFPCKRLVLALYP